MIPLHAILHSAHLKKPSPRALGLTLYITCVLAALAAALALVSAEA
jgi:hypothetical protein